MFDFQFLPFNYSINLFREVKMGSTTDSGAGKEDTESAAPPPYSLVADNGLIEESGNVQGMSGGTTCCIQSTDSRVLFQQVVV